MKLSGVTLSKVEQQFGIDALPDDHEVTQQLREAFGDHTFFIDVQGLNIVEPMPETDSAKGAVIKVASWVDDQKTLRGHEPEVRPVIVDFE